METMYLIYGKDTAEDSINCKKYAGESDCAIKLKFQLVINSGAHSVLNIESIMDQSK